MQRHQNIGPHPGRRAANRLPRRGMGFLRLMMLIAALGSTGVYASPPQSCSTRLIVELTPDVPNPRDPGFLSSLLSNHPDYAFTWVRQDASSTIVVDLSGPGPDDRCQAVIGTMLKDGRVEAVRAESEDL